MCLSSYAAVLLTRWKGGEQVTSNGAIPGMYVRSSSRAQLHQKKMELEKDEKLKTEKHTKPSFIDELSNRSDLCFHIGNTLETQFLTDISFS